VRTLVRRTTVRQIVTMATLSSVAVFLVPAVALGHQITERYAAPLPLVAYVAGAALAVAMSFVFVMLRNAPAPSDVKAASRPRTVPAWLRLGLRAVGLLAWLWIVAQTLVGGSGDGDVASLFVWVYGWVGVALLSALVGPIWGWLDPFSTLHAIVSWVGARLRLSIGEPAAYPARLGRWPAVIGFAAVVWIELVARLEGGRSLGLVLIAYTLITVAAMAYFGRETWRANGETFSVWFRLLGRLAPFEQVGVPEDGLVRRRPFARGLLEADWVPADLVLVALAAGSIILDGLTQTQLYFDLVVVQGLLGNAGVRDTVAAVILLGGLVLIVLAVARRIGYAALGAGLLPVAIGYLIAHYLAFLLVDGQRILFALNDPLARGDNLLPIDLGDWEPTLFVPTAIMWSIQLAAVVGGHIVGAWLGHAALARQRGEVSAGAQLPLALLMVILTSVTLWSLGQAVLIDTTAALP
jgi:hypothetical protein